MIQTTYQKKTGEIIKRETYGTYRRYRVGDTTVYGWKVLAIKYRYGNKWLDRVKYDTLIDKAYKRDKKIFKIKQKITYLYKNLVYFFSIMLLFRLFELSTKISF